MGDTDQFHVGEHHARTLVAVIKHNIDAGLLQFGIKPVGGGLDGIALVVAHRYDADLERRDGGRQHDALVVIALLNGSADDARHADTVAAHFHDLALAVLIQEGAVERLGVFAAQLEDVADFDAAADVENPLAVRRGISGNDVADVDDRRLWQVAAEIDAAQVVAGFIGATDEIG